VSVDIASLLFGITMLKIVPLGNNLAAISEHQTFPALRLHGTPYSIFL